jgi:hypothetical protein
VVIALLGLFACQPQERAEEVGLSSTELLVRVSLDLRGVRPSLSELAAVEADPEALDGLIDGFLQDERFGERVADIFALAYRTRLDRFTPDAAEFGIDPALDPAFQAAIGDEPLRLLAYVAENDRPWTEIVTADYTVVDEVLAMAWPVDYPAGASGWQAVPWTDGRPAAGVLSTNGLWWRYTSTMENYNRGRANAASRILLCQDFLARPVSFPRSDAAPGSDELLEQTKTDPSCIPCHNALDPLGSFFYGFDYFYEPYYMTPEYNHHAEQSWLGGTGLAPSYFGQSASGLGQLGELIAADPRFLSCTVERVFEGMLHRAPDVGEYARLVHHREAFLDGELRLRALVRSMISDASYTGRAPGAEVKLLPVEVLASSVEDLTGFRWRLDDFDMLSTDTVGFRTLGGGFDGSFVLQPIRRPNPTVVLVQQRLAELAAPWAVEHDAERGSPLFGADDPDQTIETLFRRALSRSPTATEAGEARALWEAVLAETSTEEARVAVLTYVLRHPDFLLY